MIVKTLISTGAKAYKPFVRRADKFFLNVSEFYCDTIQGEGIYIGQPAAFLRLQGCIFSCVYCDTKEVWKYGLPYSYGELFELMEEFFLIDKFAKGQHLVITGGSPLLQQQKIWEFITRFTYFYHFKPFIEVENECVIMPSQAILPMVNCWNNSPKLESSLVDFDARYKPEVIKFMSSLDNSWFKFVIANSDDWDEIEAGFLMPKLIKREQMPEGDTREKLERHKNLTLEMAIENNVRYSTREHINLWNKKVGV